jgi:hyaluronan synthase
MFWAVLQLLDLIYYQKVGVFLVFFCFVWTYFLVKFAFARKYKPYTTKYQSSVSVIVPTYRESKEMLERAIASMTLNDDQISEIIYAVDYRDLASLDIVRSHIPEFNGKMSAFVVNQKGKRAAVAEGLQRATGQIAIVMDSDTIMANENTVSELIKPFADPSVGGVVGNQRILIDDGKKIQKRVGDWIESMRAKISYPAMSSQGTVGCLAGRCIAFRRSIVLPHLF